jgi:hypothetical protein
MPLALFRFFLAALATLALAAGCGSTQVRQRWSDPADSAGPPRKLAVFVAVDDPRIRHMAEDLAARAIPRPTAAAAGHTLGLPPQPEDGAVRERLAEAGFDAALVARLVSRDTTRREVPPQTYVGPDPLAWPYFHRPWYPYYFGYPYVYTSPGYVVETTHVVVESQLYRLPGSRPVWSAVTDSIDPPSSIELVEELIRVLTRELQEARLLPPS